MAIISTHGLDSIIEGICRDFYEDGVRSLELHSGGMLFPKLTCHCPTCLIKHHSPPPRFQHLRNVVYDKWMGLRGWLGRGLCNIASWIEGGYY